MRRVNTHLVAALLTGPAAVLTAGSALAGHSRLICLGALGDQHILFNESGLVVTGGKTPAGKPAEVETRETESRQVKTGEAFSKSILDLAVAARAGGLIQFGRGKSEGPRAMAFLRTDDNKQTQKVILTERSSKQVSHSSVRICGRLTDFYWKVYRYKRDGEPARDITVMCGDGPQCTLD